jgi:phosphate transport system permease protein
LINKKTLKSRIKEYISNPMSAIIYFFVMLATFVTFFVLLYIIGYILVKGVPYLKPSLFEFNYNSDNVSMMPAIITTIMMTGFSLLLSVPIGVFTAIYLVEYAKKGNKFVEIVRLTAETLSGIPSIIYGLFGMIFFVSTLGWGFSLMAGAFTLAIMILPLIMRSTEEALKSVPDTFREASFGLGAGKLRTIFKIIVPSAMPGISAGIILGIGRIVGETAALIYTAGTMAKIPTGFFESGRTLSIHMYRLSSEGFNMNEANATAVVLLIIVVGLNTLSAVVAKRFTKG